MKVRLNENTILKVYEHCEEDVINENEVSCSQIDCIDSTITCEDCCLGNKVIFCKYSEIKVD